MVLYEMPEGRELARLKTGKCETVLFDPAAQDLITSGGHGLFRWPIRLDPGPDPAAAPGRTAGTAAAEVGHGYDYCRAAWLPDRQTIALITTTRHRPHCFARCACGGIPIASVTSPGWTVPTTQ